MTTTTACSADIAAPASCRFAFCRSLCHCCSRTVDIGARYCFAGLVLLPLDRLGDLARRGARDSW